MSFSRVLTSLAVEHDWRFLVVAALVCGLAAFIALHALALSGGRRARLWFVRRVISGATAGAGIWAAQLIALLAFEPIDSNLMKPAGVVLALACSVLLSTAGIMSVDAARPRSAVLGGAIVGFGLCLTLVANVRAFDLQPVGQADYAIMAMCFGLAVALSSVAMGLHVRITGLSGRGLAGGALTLAVAAAYAGAVSALAGVLPPPGSGASAPLGNAPLAAMTATAATIFVLVCGIAAVIGGDARGRAVSRSRARSHELPAAPETLKDAMRGGAKQSILAASVILWSPIIGFAVTLIVVIWGASLWQRAAERESDLNDVSNDAANIARIIEQNVERTANNLDTTLKYIRRTYERSGYSATWASLISDEYTNSALTVQIAAIDARGHMISSSAMLNPEKVIDLSDREHFLALAKASGDPLYISRPMTGRASGKLSVQFARRIFNKERAFDGILVASLTSDYLTAAFGTDSLGRHGGIALFGADGVIRAGSGLYAGTIGKKISEVSLDGLPPLGADLSLGVVTLSERTTAVATRPVSGYPLAVRVVLQDASSDLKRQTRWWLYVIGSSIATILILYVALLSVYNHHVFQARIVRLAHFDTLTEIPNRTQFNSILESAFAARDTGSFFALLLVDLDGFKYVNDTHGHPLGDQLLKAVARRVKSDLRSDDTLARLGGDEFAILQTGLKDEANALALASRLCRILSMPFEIEGFTVTVGGSIGIATSKDARNGRDLLKAADLALYEAKTAGRGTYKFFDSKMEAAFRERRQMERDLKVAVETGQFELFYQPIVEIQSGRVSGYEALVRWHHPERGFIAPGEFISVAEETGLILPLGEWIIRRACADVAGCEASHTVAVNCSALQFKSVDFVETVTSALSETGLDPHRLVLEITESILMSKDAATTARLTTLRKLGVGLSLDDFGTGYSSLSYVMSYPFSVLKIDRSFTSQLCGDIRGASVVKAICALAGSLNMKSVAEGVENQQQLEALKVLGCKYAQGYYFSRPKPAAEILDRAREAGAGSPAGGAPGLARPQREAVVA